MRKSALSLLAVAAASTLVLTGCGTTEPAADESTDTSSAAIAVVDDRGETIELDAPAKKVVALEWNATESLVSLGVMPTGVADPTGYASYVKAAPLDEDVTDVGQRGEPSVDAIAGLAPDLVVVTNDLSESAISQIEEIAPVLVLRGADASNAVGQMEKNLNNIAIATGTEDEAKELLTELDDAIADGKTKLEEAGFAGQNFALSDAFTDSGTIYIRPYFAGSLLSDITEQLGLVNAWKGEGDANYGLGSADVEGLTKLPADVNFLYMGSPDGDTYANDLKDNAIWTSLPFVKDDKVVRLPDGIWMFGGPSSMILYVDSLVDALASK